MPETVIIRPRGTAPGAGGGSVILTLGPVAFGVSTTVYQRLRRTTAYRWPALERAGRWPARQFTGPGNDQITIDGVVMPTYRGSVGAVDAPRELAMTGEPQQMSAGTGEVFGFWCLAQVEEDRSGLFSDGALRGVSPGCCSWCGTVMTFLADCRARWRATRPPGVTHGAC